MGLVHVNQCLEENQEFIDLETDTILKVSGSCKEYYYELLNKKDRISPGAVLFQDEETFYAKQGKGILSIYVRRHSIYYITFDQSTKDLIQKSISDVCRTCSSL